MEKSKIVKMENRAWKGIRLVTERIELAQYSPSLPFGTETYHIYTIERHIPRNLFMLQREHGIAELFHSSIKIGYTKPIEGCYGGITAWSKTIKPLIRKIEELENVKVEITDSNISNQEKYAIEDNARILKQYPSWKTPTLREEVLS